jgi:hypothetical protein
MWRAFFLAIGISLCLLGGEALLLEKATVRVRKAEPQSQSYLASIPYLGAGPKPSNTREVQITDAAAWLLITSGAMVTLYSVTVARSG